MNYQDYQIVLSPDLELNAEEFAAAWNANSESRAISEARISSAKATSFEPITIGVVLITIGTGIVADVLAELIKDLIKNVREQKKQRSETVIHRKIRIEQLDKPDGTHYILVHIEQ